MRNVQFELVAIVATLGIAACGGTQRNAEMYRNDTQSLLESRSSQIQSCYDQALAGDAKMAGKLTVKFVVEKKTGAITKASVDPTQSSASEPLVNCVLTALQGLHLDPPDRNEGQASFVYEFKPPAA